MRIIPPHVAGGGILPPQTTRATPSPRIEEKYPQDRIEEKVSISREAQRAAADTGKEPTFGFATYVTYRRDGFRDDGNHRGTRSLVLFEAENHVRDIPPSEPLLLVGPQKLVRDEAVSEPTHDLLTSIALEQLATELSTLRDAMKTPGSTAEQDVAVGVIASAETEARQRNPQGTIAHLSNAGQLALDVGKQIGAPITVAAITQLTGLT